MDRSEGPAILEEAGETRARRRGFQSPHEPVGGVLDRESVRKIAVFRALKLGDMLCAVPALRALRAGFPTAEIVLIGLPWAREFARRFDRYVDSFREFPGFPGLPEQGSDPDEVEAFFRAMEREAFDLALQCHGSGSVSNRVTGRLGARLVAAFVEPGSRAPGPGLFAPYPGEGLEVRRLLRLASLLGVPPRGEHLEFPIFDDERAEAEHILRTRGLAGRRFVCVHAGASVPERRWPFERFAAVADALADRGYAVALTGAAQEAPLTAAVSRAMRSEAVDLAGATPLGALAAVVQRARLLVCNDTGVSHVADGLRLPSVVVSTGDNPARWAPVDGRLHRVLCRDGGVAADEVLAASLDLLSGGDYV